MKQCFRFGCCAFLFIVTTIFSCAQNKIIVFQTDYGLKDGAVSAMKGVAMGVSTDLKLFDLTHEIPAFNIWEAAYRLEQTVQYWPAGTVFVSVVDPGVGTTRKSVVLKTNSGHFIVTPDNGTLTLIAQSLGIAELREIEEKALKNHTHFMAGMSTPTPLRGWQPVSSVLNKWGPHCQTKS
jgi:S-adenosylmethionine hydrolase